MNIRGVAVACVALLANPAHAAHTAQAFHPILHPNETARIVHMSPFKDYIALDNGKEYDVSPDTKAAIVWGSDGRSAWKVGDTVTTDGDPVTTDDGRTMFNQDRRTAITVYLALANTCKP